MLIYAPASGTFVIACARGTRGAGLPSHDGSRDGKRDGKRDSHVTENVTVT